MGSTLAAIACILVMAGGVALRRYRLGAAQAAQAGGRGVGGGAVRMTDNPLVPKSPKRSPLGTPQKSPRAQRQGPLSSALPPGDDFTLEGSPRGKRFSVSNPLRGE